MENKFQLNHIINITKLLYFLCCKKTQNLLANFITVIKQDITRMFQFRIAPKYCAVRCS